MCDLRRNDFISTSVEIHPNKLSYKTNPPVIKIGFYTDLNRKIQFPEYFIWFVQSHKT